MTALDECHARGFLYKAVGNCNDIKREVNKCLSAERADRAKRNRDDARNKRARIEEIWARERGQDSASTSADAGFGAAANAESSGAKQ
jgi:COX assembly protein 2